MAKDKRKRKPKGGAKTQPAPKSVSVTICPPPMAAVGRTGKAGG